MNMMTLAAVLLLALSSTVSAENAAMSGSAGVLDSLDTAAADSGAVAQAAAPEEDEDSSSEEKKGEYRCSPHVPSLILNGWIERNCNARRQISVQHQFDGYYLVCCTRK